MLLKGVERYGMGSWKQILDCPDYHFVSRTAVDLKDRFRICSRQRKKLADAGLVSASKHPSTSTHTDDFSALAPSDVQPLDHDVEAADFPVSKRRRRIKWTDVEDDALLSGFRKYGASWTSIQLDPRLMKRTPTDIRDRFRIRFSAEYKAKGLAPKQHKTQSRTGRNHTLLQKRFSDTLIAEPPQGYNTPEGLVKENKSSAPTISNNVSLSVLDDSWLTNLLPADGDYDDAETDPIVLDRSIVDWANRQLPSLPSVLAASSVDPVALQGIDPLATLLPKPTV